AVEALKAIGAKLIPADGRPITRIFFDDTKVNDSHLAYLSGLPQLEAVSLAGTGITDQGLRHLQGLPKLRQLNLSETKVTDAGMSNLEGLKLDSLFLDRTAVTGAKREELRKKLGLGKL